MSVLATYTTHNDDDTVHDKMAQPFTVSAGGNVTSVEVHWLCKGASSLGNIVCDIYSDNAGTPNASLETSSTTIAVSTLPSAGTQGPQTFTFAGTTALATATTYYVVLTDTNGPTSSPTWGVGNTSIPYARYQLFIAAVWVNGAAGFNADFVVNGSSASGPANVKKWDGVTQSTGIKTYEAVALASVKTVIGVA